MEKKVFTFSLFLRRLLKNNSGFVLLCSTDDVGVHSQRVVRDVSSEVHVHAFNLDLNWFYLVCSVLRVV